MKKIITFFLLSIFFFFNVTPVEAKKIALTFDADLTPNMLARVNSGQVKSYYNDTIADYVVKNKIPVTLFLTGLFTQTYRTKLTQLATNPFIEFENHSYDHYGFTSNCYGLKMTTNKKSEIEKTNSIIKEVVGVSPTWFRFPGGCHSQKDDGIVTNLNMKIASWTLVSGDAFNQNYKNIAKNVLTKATDGGIVVMHFGSVNAPGTGRALPLIVEGLKKQGFELVTLNQL